MSLYKESMNAVKMSDTRKQRIKNLYSEVNQKEVRKMKMRKMIKPVAGIAACMACVLAAGTIGNKVSSVTGETNEFVMSVKAAELTDTNATPVLQFGDGVNGACFGGSSDSSEVSYAIEAPLTCEGENIDSITYSINQGAFQVMSPEGQSVVVSGTEYEEELNVPAVYKDDNDVMALYKEYTVNYDKQTTDAMTFNICGIQTATDIDAALDLDGTYTLEQQKAGLDEVLGNVVITCTVHFTDGTTQNKEIHVVNKIMTEAEALPADQVKDAAEQSVFMLFELK